jgi:CrcB protein
VLNYFLVFIGGGLGAAARYWMSGAVYRLVEPDFPYGVLAVNIVGCLMIGFLMTGFEERFMINPSLRIFLTIGILGGFTTFSSFSYETISLIKDGEFFYAAANIGASVILCLTASYLGTVLGKLI